MSLQLLKFLSPPPINITADYDGLEYRWKMFTFRPALFKQEVFLLGLVLAYVAWYVIAKGINKSKAEKWYKIHKPILETQFSKNTALIEDGSSDFFAFSTGRRAVKSLHTTFTLRPRHDLAQYLFQFARGLGDLNYQPLDELELDFTFRDTANVPECVWAAVMKDELRGIREKRWDLTFTKTTENPALPPAMTVMSEFADITTSLLKPIGALNLPTVLSDPKLLPYLRSLSLTDQPRTRPKEPPAPGERSKHLIISLALPPASDAAVTIPLLNAALQLVDVIAGEGKSLPASARGGLQAALRPETKTKLKKIREEMIKELKEEASKEKKEEQEAERVAQKKKEQEERLSKLSAAEQKKALEKDKKRSMRKMQGKVKVR